MAVIRRGGFPRRQEDPLIQQLLEKARREAAQSSAIGSPQMYQAAAGGGIGPVAGVLTAQVLAGARSRNALQAAENRLKRQDEYATKVSEIQRAIDAGPSQELIPGQITVSPENQIESFRGVPYAPQAVTVGELTEDRNMLGRVADALTGKERLEQETLSRNPQTALSQALRGAGINEIEYDYFKGQLSKSNTTIREFDGNLVSINNDTGEVATLKEGTNKSGVEKISDGIYKLYKDGRPLTREDGSPVTAKGVTVRTKDNKLVTKINRNGVFVDGNLLGEGITFEPASKASVSKTNINIEDKSEAEEQKEEAKQRVKITLDSVYSNDANNPGLLQQAKKAQNGYNNLIESFNFINALPNTQGGLAEAKRVYLSFKTGLGIPVSQEEIDTLTDMTILKSKFNKSTIDILDSFKGTLSEKELQYANNVMSQLGNTPNANRIIVLLGMYNFDKVRKFNDIFREKSNKLRADGKLDELYTVKSSAEMIDDYDQYLSKRESPIEFIENLAEKEAEVLVNNMTNNNPQNLTPQQIDDKVAQMIQERYLLDKLSTFFSGYPRWVE